MNISFVGLGQMGRPIAANLARGEPHLLVAARDDRAFAGLADDIETTTDLSRIVEGDVAFLCLSDAQAVEAVLFGQKGIAPDLRAGQTVVDLGTSDYAATQGIARRLAARGVDFLDAPVSGMAARARDGTLTVMCGGERHVFERMKPLLERFGSTILHVGPTGCGQLMKLVNQLLFDINAAALAEVLPMAVKLGLDPTQVGEAVNSGTARSYASEFFVPRLLEGRFSDGYPMRDAYKDLVSGSGISASLAIPMPLLAAATAIYQTALLDGHGEKDKGGMIRVLEDRLGVAFRHQRDNEEKE